MECTAQIEVSQQLEPVQSLIDSLDSHLHFIRSYNSIMEDILFEVCGETSKSRIDDMRDKLLALTRAVASESEKAMDKSASIYRRTSGH